MKLEKQNLNSSDMPLVSVIVALYNADKYIKYCLDSLINQTYSNLEIIIVNDASTDCSLHIAKEYEDKFDNIKLVSMPNNVGYLNATNIGFTLSTGMYITFLDSDDTSVNIRIKSQLDYLHKNNLDLVGTNCTIIDENSKVIRKINYPSYKNKGKPSYIKCCGSSILFKREILSSIGPFNPLFSRIGSEDFEWLIRCTKKYKFENMNEYLYCYRKTSNSITMDLDSIYSLERSISHKLAEKLVEKYSNACFNNYWKQSDVVKYFSHQKSHLIEKEGKYPILTITRILDSLIFQKKYKEALTSCTLFLKSYPFKISSYKLFLKITIKIMLKYTTLLKV